MTLWVLVGYGPNDVEIPALIWTNKDAALAACIEIFDAEPEIIDGKPTWMHEEDLDAIQKMFVKYYGGCGECYSAALVEVEEGKPFVGWNLD